MLFLPLFYMQPDNCEPDEHRTSELQIITISDISENLL